MARPSPECIDAVVGSMCNVWQEADPNEIRQLVLMWLALGNISAVKYVTQAILETACCYIEAVRVKRACSQPLPLLFNYHHVTFTLALLIAWKYIAEKGPSNLFWAWLIINGHDYYIKGSDEEVANNIAALIETAENISKLELEFLQAFEDRMAVGFGNFK